MDVNALMLIGAAVLLVAVLSARLAAKLGLPSLLIFLIVGMLLEPFGIRLDDPALAHELGFAALVLILGEGGLTTKWADIRKALTLATLLATVGVCVSIAVVAVFAHGVLGLPPATAMLIGAVTAPTDSAAVFSVLRSVPLPARLKAVLEGESGLNDAPIVLLVGVATSLSLGDAAHGGVGEIALHVVVEFVGGLLLGAVIGWLGRQMLLHVALPASGLYPLAIMGTIVLAYGLGNLGHVSGFAAVYACAVLLGNSTLPHRATTQSFAEGVGWIAQIALFVMLGMLAKPDRLDASAVVGGLVLGAWVTFVARPLSVLVCAIWERMPIREQMFISWAGLRGAVPIIMATVPLAAGTPHAAQIFDVVLVFVTVFTLIQAPTLPWVARKLGVTHGDEAVDIDVEIGPLDRISADFMAVAIPEKSRLAGVTIKELRLPTLTVVALIVRDGAPIPVTALTTLRPGDELMIVVPARDRHRVEERLARISTGGRLASWLEGSQAS